MARVGQRTTSSLAQHRARDHRPDNSLVDQPVNQALACRGRVSVNKEWPAARLSGIFDPDVHLPNVLSDLPDVLTLRPEALARLVTSAVVNFLIGVSLTAGNLADPSAHSLHWVRWQHVL